MVDSQNGIGQLATQVVNADLTEAAPLITGVFDTASSTTTIANNGTTTNALSTVKGTGAAGDTIFFYDGTYTANLELAAGQNLFGERHGLDAPDGGGTISARAGSARGGSPWPFTAAPSG